MNAIPAVLGIYRSSSPAEAFRALFDALSVSQTPHCAAWVGPDRAQLVCCHPEGLSLPEELLSIAGHVSQPEVFSLAALSPVAAERFPGSDLLLLPLPPPTRGPGAVMVVAPRGVFGEELAMWDQVAEALASVAERDRRLREAHEERDALRKRAQEMEALDVLGLAVNRTLDPDEVLSLVARFTRTLLGAHYAIVHTTDGGEAVRALAWVGLVDGTPVPERERFAERVVAAGRPLVLGASGEPIRSRNVPFHASQGMKAGLGVPLSLFGETFGALVVGYRTRTPVTSRDTLLALTLARHAAVAINNSRLHAQLSDRSVELERAYAELHRASTAKERFFASMSHELRTPLNGILGYQALLLEGLGGELGDTGRSYLEKSNRAATSLLQLVNDILDYAKLEAGRVELNLRPTTVQEIVADAIANVEPLAAQKGIALEATRDADAEPLVTDPDRVRQVLLNLLSNAIKFTEKGTVALEVADRRAEDGWLELRVRDSGPGIRPADREKIFEEFEQVQGTRGGTGLGLPISRRLAELMGGRLTVESELGQGSTFIFRLPAEAPAGTLVSSDAA
jgi:signal transduction histidine kinase